MTGAHRTANRSPYSVRIAFRQRWRAAHGRSWLRSKVVYSEHEVSNRNQRPWATCSSVYAARTAGLSQRVVRRSRASLEALSGLKGSFAFSFHHQDGLVTGCSKTDSSQSPKGGDVMVEGDFSTAMLVTSREARVQYPRATH